MNYIYRMDEYYDIYKKGKKYKHVYNNKTVSENIENKIKKLGIPPAYKKVWLSKKSKTKVQAISFDDKNRKQYKYHPSFVEKGKRSKYLRLKKFIKSQSTLKRKVKEDITLHNSNKNCVIANMFLIMMKTNIRVGNKKYCLENGSYGLTTMLKRHLSKDFVFNFKGKSGIKHSIPIKDNHLKKFLKNLKRISGKELFKYKEENVVKIVTSNDMNEYLQNKTGKDFTCKDFRTLASNMYFIKYIKNLPIPLNKTQTKKNITISLNKTAEKLGHNRSTSKNSYVSPKVINKYTKHPNAFSRAKNIKKFLYKIL